MRGIIFGPIIFAAALAGAAPAAALDYPTKPVTIVVPAAPGGGLDRVARLIDEKLQAKWGQPIVIENRGGAAGIVGSAFVAHSNPDGYTLLFGGTAQIVINNKDLYPSLPYDPNGWVPVSLVTTAPNVLVVNPKVAANNVQELIALAKAEPGKLNYASQGVGTTQQLSVELIKSMTGTDMVHIPYGGGAPALVALLSGQVDLMFTEISGVLPHIRAGELRALAVGSDKRNALLPDVPAMSEILPGFVSMTWQAVVAPAGTPAPIADKLSRAIAEALKQPDVAKVLADSSLDPIGSTPADLAIFMQQERDRWGRITRAIGAKAE